LPLHAKQTHLVNVIKASDFEKLYKALSGFLHDPSGAVSSIFSGVISSVQVALSDKDA